MVFGFSSGRSSDIDQISVSALYQTDSTSTTTAHRNQTFQDPFISLHGLIGAINHRAASVPVWFTPQKEVLPFLCLGTMRQMVEAEVCTHTSPILPAGLRISWSASLSRQTRSSSAPRPGNSQTASHPSIDHYLFHNFQHSFVNMQMLLSGNQTEAALFQLGRRGVNVQHTSTTIHCYQLEGATDEECVTRHPRTFLRNGFHMWPRFACTCFLFW